MLRKRDMGQGRAGQGEGNVRTFSVLIGTKRGTLGRDVWTVEALVYWGAKKGSYGSQSEKLIQLWGSVDPSTDAGAKFRGNKKLASNENQAKFAPLRR